MVTFAIGLAALRSQESRRLACETLGDGNHQRLHNRRRRGRLLSLLCRAPKGDSQAFAAGATLAKNTNACTTDAGETPAFQAFAAGATLARNHQRLHNRRRRGRLRSLFCRAPEGDSPAFAAGATLNHPDDKNHRRLLSLLCRAPSAIAGLAPWRHLVASSRGVISLQASFFCVKFVAIVKNNLYFCRCRPLRRDPVRGNAGGKQTL